MLISRKYWWAGCNAICVAIWFCSYRVGYRGVEVIEIAKCKIRKTVRREKNGRVQALNNDT